MSILFHLINVMVISDQNILVMKVIKEKWLVTMRLNFELKNMY